MIVRAAKKLQQGRMEWQFGHSMGDYKSEQAQIEQDIYTALYEWKYNCFFASENGIDWYIRLGYPNQKKLLDDDVTRTIEGREGVLAVTDFESSVAGRNYVCSCNVYTIYSKEATNINFTVGV